MDLFEFKASLVYKASSRTVRAVTQRNPVSEKQKQKQKKKEKALKSDRELDEHLH